MAVTAEQSLPLIFNYVTGDNIFAGRGEAMVCQNCMLSGDVRRRIVASAAENSRFQSPADAVSDALLSAGLNVRTITLDDWKAIIFEAFDATQKCAAAS